jgi:hypothetical protein
MLAATGCLLIATAVPAVAHAGLMPGDHAPGTSGAARIVLAHGCGPGGTIPAGDASGSATAAVTVSFPEDLEVTAAPSATWAVTSADRQLRFEATDPAGVSGAVTLEVTVAVPGGAREGDRWLPVVQDCVDGEQMRWTREGVETGGEEHAAMLASIDPYAGMTEAQRADAERTPTWVILAIIVAGAVVAGGGVAALSGRRR